MRRANYVVEENSDRVVLRDVGPWDQFPTITNVAEQVISELGELIYNKRVFYYDSEGDFDELVHDSCGNFVRFRPA